MFFVNFSKAFDSVWRETMLYRLLSINANVKFYKVIKLMYSHTTTSVKLPNGITNSIKTNLGIQYTGYTGL